jgi:hypothetical protein|tara:strand:+ start:537 stop:761 length:225 start_codon:yes stop_codon:yes gene_type:complete
MGVSYGNKSVKIFTKTKHVKINNTYNAKLYGVIEGPINQMLKYYPNEFKFLRHETKEMLRSKSQSNEKIIAPKS